MKMEGVFIDGERCIGCRHCEIACAIEHSSSKKLFSMLGEEPQPHPRIAVRLGINLLTFPNKCQHCDPAPCMDVCPTGAMYRDGKTGSVQVNHEKCISCGICAMVCPHDAIEYRLTPAKESAAAFKCDGCIDRRADGRNPACVEACVTGALIFGDINKIIAERRSRRSLNLTRDLSGYHPKAIPANIIAFRKVQEKITQFGMLPSGKEE